MKQTRQRRPAKHTHFHCEMTEVKGQLSQKRRETEEKGENVTAKQREEEEEWGREEGGAEGDRGERER